MAGAVPRKRRGEHIMATAHPMHAAATRVFTPLPRLLRLAARMATLTTPDQRYIVVRGRLWRAANPNLPSEIRQILTRELMAARRAVGSALRSHNPVALARARVAVENAKQALGERGPVWWQDEAPDLNRHLVKNTPYARWYARQRKRDDA